MKKIIIYSIIKNMDKDKLERKREISRNYYQKNKEKCKIYQIEHRDEIRERARNYYHKNKETIKNTYYYEHRDEILAKLKTKYDEKDEFAKEQLKLKKKEYFEKYFNNPDNKGKFNRNYQYKPKVILTIQQIKEQRRKYYMKTKLKNEEAKRLEREKLVCNDDDEYFDINELI
jgi:hypothetical protein